jgi:dipeptidyl aminopeptidase/acylaminoacyl peptidase
MGPDGRSVVVSRREDQSPRSNLWVIDLARGTSSRLTFGPGRDASPVWSPDATRIAFVARREQQVLLTTSTSNGSKEDQIATVTVSDATDGLVERRSLSALHRRRSSNGPGRDDAADGQQRSQAVAIAADIVQRVGRTLLAGWTMGGVRLERNRPR